MCQRHQEMVYNPMNFQDELQIELRKVTDCYASLSHSDLGISENEHRLHGEHLSRINFLLNKNSHKFDRNPNFLRDFVEAGHKGVSYKLPKDNQLSKAVVSHFLEISEETLMTTWTNV